MKWVIIGVVIIVIYGALMWLVGRFMGFNGQDHDET